MRICPQCNLAYPREIDVCPSDRTPLVEAEEWPEGAVIGGKYEIVAKISQDVACTVYKALQLKRKQFRVLKVMNKHLASNPGFVKLFKRSADQLMKLRHANVARRWRASTRLRRSPLYRHGVCGGPKPAGNHPDGRPRSRPCVPVPSPSKSLPDWRRGTPRA